MPPKKIAIVGNGRYGKFFKSFFENYGHEVRVSDLGTTPSNEQIVLWADVALIAVTLLETVPVIDSLTRILREDQLVMDIVSVKSGPVDAMLKSRAEVLGTHPFTAPPRSGTFKGQTIFVCSARISRWRDWARGFFESTEAIVEEISPAQHDIERTVDQMLEHMCTLLKVSVMRRFTLNPSHLLSVASPVYRMTAAQMARMFAQDAKLYGGIPMANEHSLETLSMFREEFERYVRFVAKGDITAYNAEFETNKRYLGEKNIAESFALSEGIVKAMINRVS